MSAKPWTLVAPDWAHMDTIWRSPLPFVLWPVLGKTVLDYWLDEAVRVGVPSVTIEAIDRPHLLRRWLDQRDLWSRTIQIQSQPVGEDASERVLMDHLPGRTEAGPPDGARSLLLHWYRLQVEALQQRKSEIVCLDHEVQPGVWAGPGARIDQGAVLTAPCWIGSYARVGANCRVGPDAFIGPGAYLDEDVEAAESVVCADTYVGSHTSLNKMAAQGGLLLDFEKGLAVEVADPFVIGHINGSPAAPSSGERLLAAIVGPPLEVLAWIAAKGRQASKTMVQLGRSQQVPLVNYPAGPLCFRRAAWMRQVAKGRMRLCGVLPRTSEEWGRLPAEARSALEHAPTGVFALSDLYQCHSPADADEWTHALFQAGCADGAKRQLTRRRIVDIALTTPVSL